MDECTGDVADAVTQADDSVGSSQEKWGREFRYRDSLPHFSWKITVYPFVPMT